MQRLSEFIALGPEALEAFFQAANDVVFKDSRLPRVDRLSEPARHLYLAYVLNAEVLNGGFDQFFSNSSGAYLSETLHALRALEASPQLALLERAVSAREDDEALDQLDREYYELIRTESIEGPMLRYLQAHAGAALLAQGRPTVT